MTRGTIVLYRLPEGISHSKANRFCKELYGQDTSSHGGEYRYHIRGLLDDIPHHRLIRGAFIVRTRDVDEIVSFLREYTDTIYVREVVLTAQDERALDAEKRSD